MVIFVEVGWWYDTLACIHGAASTTHFFSMRNDLAGCCCCGFVGDPLAPVGDALGKPTCRVDPTPTKRPVMPTGTNRQRRSVALYLIVYVLCYSSRP